MPLKTQFDFSARLYTILNVAALTGIITGKVYNTSRPQESRVEDIIIVPLATDVENLSTAIININCYADNINIGALGPAVNIAKLKQFTNAILLLIDTYNNAAGKTDYFFMHIENIITIEEPTQSFVNIRVECTYENFNN